MVFKPQIRHLDSRVVLCTMHDVVEKDGTMELKREAVMYCWANVRSYKNVTPYISPAGYTIMSPSPVQMTTTHIITIRASLAVDFTSMAWIYEARRKSLPRWYKVLGAGEDGGWVLIQTRLLERSIDAQPPQGLLSPQLTRVDL